MITALADLGFVLFALWVAKASVRKYHDGSL